MKSVKCTKSAVPGDLPPRLSKEFTVELTKPAAVIFDSTVRRTVQSGIKGIWPRQWKKEYGTPLKKINEPVNEDNLRIISLTNHFSKGFEKLVMKWILFYVGNKKDRNQFGGTK